MYMFALLVRAFVCVFVRVCCIIVKATDVSIIFFSSGKILSLVCFNLNALNFSNRCY